jgi:hypothetical protein
MSHDSFQTPPVAAYLTLSPAGEALYRLGAFGLLTVHDARILTEIQWAEPLRVRTFDDDGRELLFEPINTTQTGATMHSDMSGALEMGEKPWGRMWELKTHSEMFHGLPEESEMVCGASFLKRTLQSEVRRLHQMTARSWCQGDLEEIELEEWHLPAPPR